MNAVLRANGRLAHTGSMDTQSPVLYREVFSSGWRRLVPWLWTCAALLVVGFFPVAILAPAEMAQELGPGLCFLAFWAGMAAVFLKAKKPDGEVVVTESGASTTDEGRVIPIQPGEITDIAVTSADAGPHSTFLVGDARNVGKRLACNVRPLHVDFFPTKPIPGVLIRLRSEEAVVGFLDRRPRPTFIPSNNPEALAAALRRMREYSVGK